MRKYLRYYTYVFITILTFFSFFSVSKADYKNTITTSNFPSTLKVTLKGDGLVKSDGWQIYNKHTSSNYAMCTAFNRENHNSTYSCKSQDKWSDAVAEGVAAIIKKAAGNDGKMTPTEYARAEYAINTYLITAAKGKYKKSAMKDFSKSVSAVKPLVQAAKDAEKKHNNFKKSKLNLTLTNLKCNDIPDNKTECKLDYKITGKSISEDLSNLTISVEGSSTSTASVTKKTTKTGTLVFTYNSKLTSSVTNTVTVKLKRKRYKAKDYDCGNNQSITPNIIKEETDEITLTAKRTAGFNQSKTRYFEDSSDCKVIFEKVSGTDDTPLTGAQLQFKWAGETNFQTYALENSGDAQLSGSEMVENKWCAYVLDGGSSGAVNFTYKEALPAPEGYVADTTEHTGTFDGTNQTVIQIKNNPNTKLTVKKVDGDTKQPLAGAKLELHKDGDVLHFRYTNAEQTEAVIDASSAVTSWDSSKTLTFTGLEYDEQYDVVETSAPAGYIINNPSTAVILENKAGSREQTVTLENYKSSVKISKQDITNGKEIAGATLKVIDGQGNVYDEWVSSTTPHEISKLEDGVYYLQETIAPKGYELNTTTVEFEIKNGKSRSLVVMNDSPTKLKIANTLLGKNLFTTIVGSLLIIMGAGVLGYEYKKKKATSK